MKTSCILKIFIAQMVFLTVFNTSSMQFFSNLPTQGLRPYHYLSNIFFGDTKKTVLTTAGLCGLGLGFYALYSYYKKPAKPLKTDDILRKIAIRLNMSINFEDFTHWWIIKEPNLLKGQRERESQNIYSLSTFKSVYSDHYHLVENWQKPITKGVNESLFLRIIESSAFNACESVVDQERFKQLRKASFRKNFDEFKETELFKDSFNEYYNAKIKNARDNVAICEKRSKKTKKQLVKAYKIHLMPQQSNFETVLFLLFQALKNNPELQNKVAAIKLLKEATCTKSGLTETAVDASKQVFAPLIIYPSDGKENAQFVLDTLKNILKGQAGLNVTPRYNRKVNSLIYYAQGGGDYKTANFKDYYEDDFVHYKPDFVETGVMQDYRLEI
jgi:hypothetical protein